MEDYIQITKLNDFIFCPYSLYFHSLYENYVQKIYHSTPQTIGKIKHEAIDKGKYSTEKKYIQGIPVYSEEYRLMGKIDIYNKQTKTLIERKNKIKHIYDGYRLQLIAQKVCLGEMGYKVDDFIIHSLSDNKRHVLDKPNKQDILNLEEIIEAIRSFTFDSVQSSNKHKCNNCIYNELCNYKIC